MIVLDFEGLVFNFPLFSSHFRRLNYGLSSALYVTHYDEQIIYYHFIFSMELFHKAIVEIVAK